MLRTAFLRRHLVSTPTMRYLLSGRGTKSTRSDEAYSQLEQRQLGLVTQQISASKIPAFTVVLIALAIASTMAAPGWLVFLLGCKTASQVVILRTARQLDGEIACGQLVPATVRRLIRHCFVSAFTWAMLAWPLTVGLQLGIDAFLISIIALFAVCLTVIAAAHHGAGLNAATAGGFLGLLPKVVAVIPAVGPVLLGCLPVLLATIWSCGLLLNRQSRAGIVLHMRVRRISQRLEQTNAALTETLRQAELLADHDVLTGLRNRRAFERELAGFQARFAHRQLSLMLLDIDHFKRINDRFGHETGDGVLLAIGTCLHQWESESAGRIVGRWGGEEFIVVIALRPGQQLPEELERLRLVVEQLAEQLHWPDPIALTTSIGCAPLTAPNSLQQALRDADQALYAAKDSGRNCWRMAA
jgi:diguanylate cyclase (GGDEF)-like protein